MASNIKSFEDILKEAQKKIGGTDFFRASFSGDLLKFDIGVKFLYQNNLNKNSFNNSFKNVFKANSKKAELDNNEIDQTKLVDEGQKERYKDKENQQLNLPASTTIQAAAYSPEREYLIVSFKSGHTYDYTDVPLSLILKWEEALSAGSFFYYNIRLSFKYRKLG